jgi:hypothetical protein
MAAPLGMRRCAFNIVAHRRTQTLAIPSNTRSLQTMNSDILSMHGHCMPLPLHMIICRCVSLHSDHERSRTTNHPGILAIASPATPIPHCRWTMPCLKHNMIAECERCIACNFIPPADRDHES